MQMKNAVLTSLQRIGLPRSRRASRALTVLCAVALAFGLAGDRNVRSATNCSVDPLDILDLQVKPNLLVIVDTSGSMTYTVPNPPGFFREIMSPDDPRSRLYQAKDELKKVIEANKAKIDFGLWTYYLRPNDFVLSTNNWTTTGYHKPGGSNSYFTSYTAVGSRQDGPFLYVTTDEDAKYFHFYDADGDGNPYEPQAFTDSPQGDTFVCPGYSKLAGYFCDPSDDVNDYDANPDPGEGDLEGDKSTNVFRSFGILGAHTVPYPASETWDITKPLTIPGVDEGCPEYDTGATKECQISEPKCDPKLGNCYFYLESRVLRDGRRYVWDRTETDSGKRLKAVSQIDCSTMHPPADLIGFTHDDNGDKIADEYVPCIQMVDSADSNIVVTYYYSGSMFSNNNSLDNCSGGASIAPAAACTKGVPDDMYDALRPALPVDSSGIPMDVTPNPATATRQNGRYVGVKSDEPLPGLGAVGLRADTQTPIGETLNAIRKLAGTAQTPFTPATGLPDGVKQNNFILLLTDGNTSCWNHGRVPGLLRMTQQDSADQAKALYDAGIQTLVVAFTTAADKANADMLAYAGSGATSSDNWVTHTCADTVPCRGAFTAINKADLALALKKAIAEVTGSGTYTADRSSISASVYELYQPANRDTRYNMAIPVSVESTFEMPGFAGHFTAYHNPSGTPVPLWDAAKTLLSQVTVSTTAQATFDDLRGGAGTTDASIAGSTALIKRRIYTTTQNGVNDFYTVDNLRQVDGALQWTRVALWPPDNSVDPAIITDAGVLDDELGLSGMSFAELQDTFHACEIVSGQSFPSGHDACTGADKEAMARKEAREMILASMAGAEVRRVDDGIPERDTGTAEIYYKRKDSVLADANASTPGIVGPPPDYTAAYHRQEYDLYRFGPRDGSNHAIASPDQLARGFGLRHPDKDGQDAADVAATIKPVMTVVYHAANDMLHAFRAANCPAGAGGCAGDIGGAELWGFVPYDQLGKLTDRLLKPNTRQDHIFMMAAPVRVADVFLSGKFTYDAPAGDDKTYGGVWRTLLIAGRGPGGKYYTALDVTAPGSYLATALTTAPPIVVWNRGNPDTTDGLASGTPVRSTSDPDYGVITGGTVDLPTKTSQLSGYSLMGETWSVPAIGMVQPGDAVTENLGREFVAWTTSGCSDVPAPASLPPGFAEGRSIFSIDPLTGDLIAAHDIGDCDAGGLIASPAGFQPTRLAYSPTGSSPVLSITDPVTGVYVGDLKGRMYFVDPSHPTSTPLMLKDYGSGQPFGAGVSLLNVETDSTGKKPHVYAATGDDKNVTANPDDPFLMVALRDNQDGNEATEVYQEPFVEDYRGTVQPVSSFLGDGTGVTFFAGTHEDTSACVSSFDSVIYALQAGTSGADPVYELPLGDHKYMEVDNPGGGRVQSLSITNGQLSYSLSKGGSAPQPATPVAQAVSSEKTPVSVGPPLNPDGTPGVPAPGTTSFKLGTSVCR